MKRNQVILFAVFAFFFSCSDDSASPEVLSHEVGDWELTSYQLTNVPEDYDSNQGLILEIDEILFGGEPLQSYEISLQSDRNFTRTIRLPFVSYVDRGEWILVEELLVFNSVITVVDVDPYFRVNTNEDDLMALSASTDFLFIKDAILDTLTQQYVDSLSIEQYIDLFDEVPLDLVHFFERKDP